MTRQALLDLAARCEQATGADRELDAAIAKAVGADHGQKTGWCNGDNGDYFVIDECSLHYTASLDAAMTLLPSNFSGQAWTWRFNEGKRRKAKCTVWTHDDGYRKYSRLNLEVYAATPALALTTACLKALAQEIEHDCN